MLMTPYNQWIAAQNRAPQQTTAMPTATPVASGLMPLTEDDVMAQLGLYVPWSQLVMDPSAYMQARQTLIDSRTEYEGVLKAYDQMDEDVKKYLANTPVEQITDPNYRIFAIALANANTALGVIDSQLEQAQAVAPGARARSTPSATSTPAPSSNDWQASGALAESDQGGLLSAWINRNQTASPTATPAPTATPDAQPATAGDYGVTAEPTDSGSDDLITRLYEAELQGRELDNQIAEQQLLQMQSETQQTTSPFDVFRQPMEFQDYVYGRNRARTLDDQADEDRQRQIQQEQDAIAAAAKSAAYSQWIQRKNLENSIAQAINSQKNQQWQFIANNALPAGTGYVPGFEPGSQLAQIMGSTFRGLPTVTLDTPDPASGYTWASRYLGG